MTDQPLACFIFRILRRPLDVAVFPNYCEAHAAAMCGVTVELGGYCEAVVTAAVDGETVTHQTSASWLQE